MIHVEIRIRIKVSYKILILHSQGVQIYKNVLQKL